MQHPVVASANAHVRYNEFVREADLRRQIKHLELTHPGFFARAAAFVTGLFASLNTEAVRATTGNTAI